MEEMHINWMAVGLASIIPMIFGFLYYHPSVVGGAWMRSNGFQKDNMKAPQPIWYFVALFLSFVLANWLRGNVSGPGQDTAPDGHSYATFGHGFVHGLVISLMVLLPVLGTLSIFERRGWNWVFVNLGYWILTLGVMGGILSAWR